MKKYVAAAGALALALGGFPVALVHAEEGSADASVQVTAVTAVRVSDDADDDDEEETDSDISVSFGEQNREEGKKLREERKEQAENELEMIKELFRFELEDDEDLASSLDDLKQKIEERKQELEDEEASTTPMFKNVVKNANEVRLAVHALLSSKELLGGIGEQVSEIAKHMNDSVATTTSVEAKIQSRGFLTKLFFGGDKKAAKVINKEVERNRESIAKLTELLNQVTLPADFGAALEAQITALKEAQARFQALAEKEQKMWGLFSWRF